MWLEVGFRLLLTAHPDGFLVVQSRWPPSSSTNWIIGSEWYPHADRRYWVRQLDPRNDAAVVQLIGRHLL
jgi:hypothetical protein